MVSPFLFLKKSLKWDKLVNSPLKLSKKIKIYVPSTNCQIRASHLCRSLWYYLDTLLLWKTTHFPLHDLEMPLKGPMQSILSSNLQWDNKVVIKFLFFASYWGSCGLPKIQVSMRWRFRFPPTLLCRVMTSKPLLQMLPMRLNNRFQQHITCPISLKISTNLCVSEHI